MQKEKTLLTALSNFGNSSSVRFYVIEIYIRDAIRIPFHFMLMSRWRAIQLRLNLSACEQAPISQFNSAVHRL